MPRQPPKSKRRFQIKMEVIAASDDDTESVASSAASESGTENLDAILAELKQQLHTVYTATKVAQVQVASLFQRAKEETTEWMMEPMRARAPLRPWLEARGLSVTPTLEEFIDACMDAAVSMDLDTRTLTFKPEDAAILWKGQRRITVYQMMAAIPSLFHS